MAELWVVRAGNEEDSYVLIGPFESEEATHQVVTNAQQVIDVGFGEERQRAWVDVVRVVSPQEGIPSLADIVEDLGGEGLRTKPEDIKPEDI